MFIDAFSIYPFFDGKMTIPLGILKTSGLINELKSYFHLVFGFRKMIMERNPHKEKTLSQKP